MRVGEIKPDPTSLTNNRERYGAMEKNIKSAHAENANTACRLVIVRYGRRASEALLRWCDDAAETLNSMTAKPLRSHGATRRSRTS